MFLRGQKELLDSVQSFLCVKDQCSFASSLSELVFLNSSNSRWAALVGRVAKRCYEAMRLQRARNRWQAYKRLESSGGEEPGVYEDDVPDSDWSDGSGWSDDEDSSKWSDWKEVSFRDDVYADEDYYLGDEWHDDEEESWAETFQAEFVEPWKQLLQRRWEKASCSKSGLFSNKGVVLSAVSLNGFVLRDVSSELQNDKEVVSAALRNRGEVLKWASPALQSDKDVVLLAAQKDGFSLKYTGHDLRSDEDVLLAAATKKWRLLEEVHPTVKGKKCVLAVVREAGGVIEWVDPFGSEEVAVLVEANPNLTTGEAVEIAVQQSARFAAALGRDKPVLALPLE